MVDDQENKTEEPKEPTSTDAREGNKYETTPIIERAREERERMEKATASQKVENDRAEKIMARRELGGGSGAGTKPEPPKEIDNEEYARDILAGKLNEKE